MTEALWEKDWETRPLVGKGVYSIPSFSLTFGKDKSLSFRSNRVTIGSDPANDVVLESDTVSRFHAEIRRHGDGYLIVDLGSTNGVWIKGVRVKEAWLPAKSELELGDVKVVFTCATEVVCVEPSASTSLGDLVGVSPEMKRLFRLVELVAPTDATVLIEGETGTGKGVLARTIHQFSNRKEGPFVVVDCSAIPAGLMESELFGHEKGSFSGAISGRKGLFEMAHRGTVFLDEIGELPIELQPKLLRVLETGEVRRVGSPRTIPLDVRIVAATNRNLWQEVQEKKFRQDLFFRLNVVPVRLSPLRERREDIDVLVAHVLARAKFNDDGRGGRRVTALSPALMDRLRRYWYPGNVRELVNLVERAVSLGEEALDSFDAEHPSGAPEYAEISVGKRAKYLPPLLPFKDAKEAAIREFEESYLTMLVEKTGGNISSASRQSGLDRKHLRQLLRKHGLYYGGWASESVRSDQGKE